MRRASRSSPGRCRPRGGPPSPAEQLGGSLAAVAAAARAGCAAVRVHDVFPSVQAARVTEAMR
ncbi:MAG: hypothetical protein R3B82_07440 [Sandaracinaceae bacterium]